jgi:hypothetical protein
MAIAMAHLCGVPRCLDRPVLPPGTIYARVHSVEDCCMWVRVGLFAVGLSAGVLARVVGTEVFPSMHCSREAGHVAGGHLCSICAALFWTSHTHGDGWGRLGLF